jgi:hypothetical protein
MAHASALPIQCVAGHIAAIYKVSEMLFQQTIQTNCSTRAHGRAYGLAGLHGSICTRPTAAARSRRCQAFAVARPRQTACPGSYVDIIQAHERSLSEARTSCISTQAAGSTNSKSQPTQYLSDPAVYLNRDSMLHQVKSTFQQVATVSKQAAREVAAAFNPEQARSSSQHLLGIPSNATHHPAAVAQAHQPQPLQTLSRQAARLTQAVSEDIHSATQVRGPNNEPHVVRAMCTHDHAMSTVRTAP